MRVSSPRAGRIPHPASRIPLLAAVLLFTVYVATLAPGVTFWDPGELIAAVHVLGIPHPPGTPLFVMLGRAWSELLGWLPRATATNMLSAACTAGAGGVLAWLVGRTTGEWLAAFGAAVCAGGMATVWLNATETEVYAASLLLASVMLAAADMAGETGETRWVVLTAYAMGLAVPLHVSALVAAPAAIVLAAQRPAVTGRRIERIRWQRALLLAGAFLIAAGAGLASWPIAAVGAAATALAAIGPTGTGERMPAGSSGPAAALLVLVALLLALSALAYLPIRAAHDPAINEGNPATWSAMWDAVGRRQYGAHVLWPRQAPLWAQVANVFEYADWQVALGLAPGVAPSWLRTPVTLVFAVLGIVGSVAHRVRDRRSWRAFIVLLLCASAGLIVYLNFKAGASFGYGVLPDNLPHEARDRDYFFTLAFWVWGAWAGFGAVVLARRVRRRPALVGALVAAAPIALNWRAVDRRRMPEALLPRAAARAMLWSAPPRAVLVTGGDNDSFPVWYLQVVEGVRPDVTVVIAPLLPARWYREQLARRDSLLDAAGARAEVHSEGEALARIASGARRLGRPLAVTLTAGPARREALGGTWMLRGVVFVRDTAGRGVRSSALDVPVDSAAASAFGRRFGWTASDTLRHESIDPAPALFARVLACPAYALAGVGSAVRADSLASPCKFR